MNFLEVVSVIWPYLRKKDGDYFKANVFTTDFLSCPEYLSYIINGAQREGKETIQVEFEDIDATLTSPTSEFMDLYSIMISLPWKLKSRFRKPYMCDSKVVT